MKDEEKTKEQLVQELAKTRERITGLEREQSLLKHLMDNIPDNIYFKDLKSRFIRINRAHAKLFGLDDAGQAAASFRKSISRKALLCLI